MNFKKILQFSIGPIGGAALTLFTLPLLAWVCTQEDIGRITMLNVTISFFALFFSIGLNQAYVREYHESPNKYALFRACLLPGLILTTLLLVCLLAIPGLLSRLLFDIDSFSISLLVAISVWFSFLTVFISLILRMQDKGLGFSIGQVLPKAFVFFVISIYAVLNFKIEFINLMLIQSFGLFLACFFYLWSVRKYLKQVLKSSVNLKEFIKIIKFGAPLIVSSAAFWGLTTFDKVFLRSFSSYEELAIYSMAVNFSGVALIFQAVFSTVWPPIAFKWASENVSPERYHQVTEWVLLAVAAIFVLMGLFSWMVTLFLPPIYNSVQYLLLSCMCYPLFYTLSETTVVGLGITRKSSYTIWASLLALIVNIAGNYYLIPLYGARGAAISTAVAFWCFFILRTELSILAWHAIPRLRNYGITFICLFLSILYVFFGYANDKLFIFLWVILGLFICIAYKVNLLSLINNMKLIFRGGM